MATSPSSPPGAQREHLNLNAAVADFGGHVCSLQSIWIVSPLLRQIQRAITNSGKSTTAPRLISKNAVDLNQSDP
jgi:hypothetical protein